MISNSNKLLESKLKFWIRRRLAIFRGESRFLSDIRWALVVSAAYSLLKDGPIEIESYLERMSEREYKFAGIMAYRAMIRLEHFGWIKLDYITGYIKLTDYGELVGYCLVNQIADMSDDDVRALLKARDRQS